MKRIISILLAAFLALLFLGTPAMTTLAQDPVRPAPGFPRPPLEQARRLPSEAAPKSQNIQPLAQAVDPWTSIVFQSLRDDNWEIYLNSPNSSYDVRLTYHQAYDGQPRLNRGANKIVFVSDRDDDDEIYTMNSDGSGLTQLTFNNKIVDNHPAWSPDGSRIAFASNRDGSYQIYVMNADGSNQTRLTNEPELQGSQPTWSPDGTQIAFAAYYYTSYRIWVMNADGSDLHQLNVQEYSENPSWSPDGKWIAYDSDGNNDGFMELWVMAANGSTQDQVYDPSDGLADAWMGSWSPDGRYLAFTQITWIYYNGKWYWTDSHVSNYDLVFNSVYYMTERDVDSFPDWQPTDITPPMTSLQPLPKYSRDYIALRMSGDDGNGIGLLGFDIQYKDASQSEWTDLSVDDPLALKLFAGDPGKTYDFRARANDLFFNADPWSQNSLSARTTFYFWGISGRTLDSAGYPVGNAGLTIAPAPALNNPVSDVQGYYAAYVGQPFNYYNTLWSKAGYNPLPLSHFYHLSDAKQDVFFPPVDDVVRDGGFESGAFLPNWTPGGVFTPTIISTMTHTGEYAAYLGQLSDPMSFMTPTLLSNPSAVSAAPAIALCPDGSAQLVWEENGVIQHTSRRGDGGFSGVKTKLSGSLSGAKPQIACDAGGGLHVVFLSSQAAYYTYKPTGGAWSAPKKVSGTRQVDFPPRLAVRADGYAHVMWGGAGVWYTSGTPGGAWSQPVKLLYDAYYDTSIMDLQMALAGDGALHALWWATGSSGYFSVFYAFRTPSGAWQSEDLNTWYGHVHEPQLALGLDGIAHVAWWHQGDYGFDVVYRRRGLDGVWSEQRMISNQDSSFDPCIAIGPDGLATVLWNVYDQTYLSRQQPGGSWLPPEAVPAITTYYSPRMWVEADGTLNLIYESDHIYAIQRSPLGTWSIPVDVSHMGDSHGSLSAQMNPSMLNAGIHAAWTDDFGKIYYAGPAVVGGNAEASLSQTLTIPADLHKPGVSLLYYLEGVASGGENQLSLAISQGVTPTVVFTANVQQAGWAHQWIDVSPWAGEQITLTLNLHQSEGAYPALAVVDEVSLGSWLTPVVQSASPQPLEANKAVQVTIYGANFIAPTTVKIGNRTADSVEYIDENTLVAHFNQGVPPGLQTLQVINPGKQEGLLPVHVGRLVYVPLIKK